MEKVEWTRGERRVINATLGAVPIVAAIATVAMLFSPHEFAESDTATGTGLWLGAVLGLTMVLVFYGLPLLLFALGLRAGTSTKVTATMIAAPLWAFLGLQPLVAAILGGCSGLSPLAVGTAAATGLLDCLVFGMALRGRRRLTSPPSHRAAATK